MNSTICQTSMTTPPMRAYSLVPSTVPAQRSAADASVSFAWSTLLRTDVRAHEDNHNNAHNGSYRGVAAAKQAAPPRGRLR